MTTINRHVHAANKVATITITRPNGVIMTLVHKMPALDQSNYEHLESVITLLAESNCSAGDYYLLDNGFEPQPKQPNSSCFWDFNISDWVDPRSLQDLKDAKWNEIKIARTNAEYGGFVWDGSTFDSDAISQSRIQGAIQLAGTSPNFTIDWTLADNSVRTLNYNDMIAVGASLVLHVGSQFSHARELRNLIENSTANQLLEVAWDSL